MAFLGLTLGFLWLFFSCTQFCFSPNLVWLFVDSFKIKYHFYVLQQIWIHFIYFLSTELVDRFQPTLLGIILSRLGSQIVLKGQFISKSTKNAIIVKGSGQYYEHLIKKKIVQVKRRYVYEYVYLSKTLKSNQNYEQIF